MIDKEARLTILASVNKEAMKPLSTGSKAALIGAGILGAGAGGAYLGAKKYGEPKGRRQVIDYIRYLQAQQQQPGV